MDAKFSDFTTAQTIGVADFFPIVRNGQNQTITAGTLFQNIPNIGNKGITKNAIVSVAGSNTTIPLTGSLINLAISQSGYTVPNGSDGQEIVLVSAGANSIYFTSAFVTTVRMGVGSSLTVVYLSNLAKWVIKSQYNCTFS